MMRAVASVMVVVAMVCAVACGSSTPQTKQEAPVAVAATAVPETPAAKTTEWQATVEKDAMTDHDIARVIGTIEKSEGPVTLTLTCTADVRAIALRFYSHSPRGPIAHPLFAPEGVQYQYRIDKGDVGNSFGFLRAPIKGEDLNVVPIPMDAALTAMFAKPTPPSQFAVNMLGAQFVFDFTTMDPISKEVALGGCFNQEQK